MPNVVFDVRANHDTGVSRYGLSLLAAAAPQAAAAGWSLTVISGADQADRARAVVADLRIPVMVPPDDGGFIRRSPRLRPSSPSGGRISSTRPTTQWTGAARSRSSSRSTT